MSDRIYNAALPFAEKQLGNAGFLEKLRDPEQKGRVLVVKGNYDKIEFILKILGIHHTIVSENQLNYDYDLHHKELLNEYLYY